MGKSPASPLSPRMVCTASGQTGSGLSVIMHSMNGIGWTLAGTVRFRQARI